MDSGKLTKMKLVAYKKPDFSDKVGEYDVLVNPDKYNDKSELKYSTNSSPLGVSAETVKFRGAGSKLFNMDFFFDSTGVLSEEPVDDQIDNLKELIYSYNGDIHEPNYVKILWGTQSLFEGRLKEWDILYSMMDLNGTPLRAEIKAIFIGSVSAKKKALEERKNSSDLTHIRTVKAGDTLPSMCFKIYGDSKYYIQVAAFNGMDNIRVIRAGDQVVFPPLV
jgi:phage tail protein X